MRPHPRDAVLQTTGRDDGVGVEDERVLALCLHDGLVVGAGKAHILLVLDVGNLRMPLAREGDAVVARQVIDDNHLARHALHGLLDSAQGLLQQVLHAVVDDDDGELHITCDVSHVTCVDRTRQLRWPCGNGRAQGCGNARRTGFPSSGRYSRIQAVASGCR